MSGSKESPTKYSTVRIFKKNGAVCGIGALVTANRIITCAHVVAKALGVDCSGDPPSGKISVDFPFIAPGNMQKAWVWSWRPAFSEDLALIDLDESPPDESRSLHLINSKNLWAHNFRVYGCPEAYPNGTWSAGLLRDAAAGGWIQLEDDDAQGFQIAPGYSGSPVWDDELEAAVGIIVAADSDVENRAGFLIPSAKIIEAWPTLKLRSRIFVSYKRDLDPDETVATEVCRALEDEHHVFIDQRMPPGTDWSDRIHKELALSDFLIVFLTAESADSDMVKLEVERAAELRHKSEGDQRPTILPVRLGYREPFDPPLSNHLDPLNWAFWERSDQNATEKLIDVLKRAIRGEDLPIGQGLKEGIIRYASGEALDRPRSKARLERPDGAIQHDSVFYIDRRADKIALEEISELKGKGVTLVIKGSRQCGKSSLLARVIERGKSIGKKIVFINFQSFVDAESLEDVHLFCRRLCLKISEELELGDDIDHETKIADWWRGHSATELCSSYIEENVLTKIDGKFILAMDEVEKTFDANFQADFFGMLRSWHNDRATFPLWESLDLVLVTSTEPYALIDNLDQSPFNVGEVISLADFEKHQVEDLNRRHGSPLDNGQIDYLWDLLGGHPFLVRKALYNLAKERIQWDEFKSHADHPRGLFGDHLRYYLYRIKQKTELADAFMEVVSGSTEIEDEVFRRLEGAGLVTGESYQAEPRCRLYRDFFHKRLQR